MNYRECLRWLPDNNSKSTEAVVVISSCGKIIKRLPYRKFNKKNNNYSSMKEHLYKIGTNRGKQNYDSEKKIKKYGLYQCVTIRDKTYSVHRLVGIAWIKKEKGKDHINHKNGIRDDNRAENLEWVSNSENVKHAWSIGLRDSKKLEKINDSQVIQMKKMRDNGYNNSKIARHFPCTSETVRLRLKKYENSI